jgi:hypothetical protein
VTYWEDLEKQDLIGKLKPLFNAGHLYIDPENGKIKRPGQVMMITNPWVFTKQADWTNCAVWHQIYFKCLNAIHSGCYRCYKVVVRPQTVRELFDLHEVMQQLGLAGKCGVETREYTKHLYGAYFYCNGLEDGKRIYRIVSDAIAKELRPDMDVILKRGCTEFEMMHGDSSKYEQSEEDRQTERLLEDNMDIPPATFAQPDILKTHIKRSWLAWAYKNNDRTCLEYNDGEDFVAQPTTYHEEDINHGSDNAHPLVVPT